MLRQLRLYPVFLHPVEKGRAGDSEDSGGLDFIALLHPQGLPDVILFNLVQDDPLGRKDRLMVPLVPISRPLAKAARCDPRIVSPFSKRTIRSAVLRTSRIFPGQG